MRKLSATLCCLLLSSCMSVKEYTTDLSPMDQTTCLEEDSSPLFSIDENALKDSKWWKIFQDEKLNALIEAGLEQNPSLLSATSKWKAVYQEALVARSALLPSLGFGFYDLYQHWSQNGNLVLPGIPLTNNLINLGLNFSYELDFFQKNKNIFQAFLGKAGSVLAEKKQADLMISISIAKEYFSLISTKVIAMQLMQLRDLYSQVYDLILLRMKNEVDNQMQVLQSKLKIQEIEQRLSEERAKEQVIWHRLNVLLGRDPLEVIEIDHYYTMVPTIPIPAQIGKELLKRRPDLNAQMWLVESGIHEMRKAKADFYPTIDLLASGGYQSFTLSGYNLFSAMSGNWTLNPTLNLPIYTGGRLTAGLASKLAKLEENIYTYNEMFLQASAEVADQVTLMKKAKTVLDEQKMIFNETLSIYQLFLSRYNYGIDPYQNVLMHNITMVEKQIELVAVQLMYQTQAIDLIKSLGGGFYESFDIKWEAKGDRRG